MRCACIDIGSNTTRLLVADHEGAGLRQVAGERVFTRLHGERGAIAGERIELVAATVAAQLAQARAAGATAVRIVATAAVRAASNGGELCAAVEAAGGTPVTVLTGEEEARLAFLGAVRTLPAAPPGVIAVVDVGGGSSEIVCGTAADGVAWWSSLPAGSGTLTEQAGCADPPSTADRERMAGLAAQLVSGLAPPEPRIAYAVGGSATSMGRMVGPVLGPQTIHAAMEAICAAPAAAVAARYALDAERARVLPAGMLLLEAASRLLLRPLLISPGGLREGVILDLAG